MSDAEITVVLSVSKRADPIGDVLALIREGLAEFEGQYDVLIAVDGDLPARVEEASSIAERESDVRVFALARGFGEDVVLRAGLQATQAKVILAHPAYLQVEAGALAELVRLVKDEGAHVAFASRKRGKEAAVNRLQRWAFNALIRRAVWVRFRDISSGVFAIRRGELRDVSVHEGFHRFLPVLAVMRGLDVREVDAPVHPRAGSARIYGPGVYFRRLLDVLNVLFLTRFVYKPLRFFGLIGSAIFFVGMLICLYFAWIRLVHNEAIGQRPLLLLGVLLVAVGFETLAVGLLGELISFVHAGRSKPYAIREVVVRKPASNEAEPVQAPDRPE